MFLQLALRSSIGTESSVNKRTSPLKKRMLVHAEMAMPLPSCTATDSCLC